MPRTLLLALLCLACLSACAAQPTFTTVGSRDFPSLTFSGSGRASRVEESCTLATSLGKDRLESEIVSHGVWTCPTPALAKRRYENEKKFAMLPPDLQILPAALTADEYVVTCQKPLLVGSSSVDSSIKHDTACYVTLVQGKISSSISVIFDSRRTPSVTVFDLVTAMRTRLDAMDKGATT